MAGRNHLQLREIPLSRVAPLPRSTTDPRLLHTRPHHHLLEDRISTQHRDIQSLLLDNQRHAATHVALKQEVSRRFKEEGKAKKRGGGGRLYLRD